MVEETGCGEETGRLGKVLGEEMGSTGRRSRFLLAGAELFSVVEETTSSLEDALEESGPALTTEGVSIAVAEETCNNGATIGVVVISSGELEESGSFTSGASASVASSSFFDRGASLRGGDGIATRSGD